jgi:hypothetical protein
VIHNRTTVAVTFDHARFAPLIAQVRYLDVSSKTNSTAADRAVVLVAVRIARGRVVRVYRR